MPQQEVWIAFRTDNIAGTGTENDPYDGSTSAKFDHVMREILVAADGYHIHIGLGTFLTLGLRHFEGTGPIYNGDHGWHVRSNWTISGSGEGLTIIKLEKWPTFIGDAVNPGDSPKWAVIGNTAADAVSNVAIENLTVDGNWNGSGFFTNPPSPRTFVALHCVACINNGPLTHRHVTAIGFYGKIDNPAQLLSQECFALCSHSTTPIDPQETDPSRLVVFDRCTANGGNGDYCVGIAAFNGGPSIINACRMEALANFSSSAIQAIGKDIQITNNVVKDCFFPFYVDTGNIINLLMEGNQFISNGPAPILTNSTSRHVYINIRQDDVAGNFDGVFIDVPIRPIGEISHLYRIRLYFAKDGLATNAPVAPNPGILVPCPFSENATADDLEGTGDGTVQFPYTGAIRAGLDAFFNAPGAPPRFVDYFRSFDAASIFPVTDFGIRIFHSQGAPSTSDESKVYVQSGWAWTNWTIRNNYLEVAIKPVGTFNQQYLIKLDGNGSTDKDYHISDNVCRFTGTYETDPLIGGIQTYALLMVGIDRVTILNNDFDTDPANYGGTRIIRAEGDLSHPEIWPISAMYSYGNRNSNQKKVNSTGDTTLLGHQLAELPDGTTFGAATAPSVLHANTTPAQAGVQQVSPATHWTGQGWRTQAPAGSQSVDFRAYVAPIQGTANPLGKWVLESSVNDGAYVHAM